MAIVPKRSSNISIKNSHDIKFWMWVINYTFIFNCSYMASLFCIGASMFKFTYRHFLALTFVWTFISYKRHWSSLIVFFFCPMYYFPVKIARKSICGKCFFDTCLASAMFLYVSASDFSYGWKRPNYLWDQH